MMKQSPKKRVVKGIDDEPLTINSPKIDVHLHQASIPEPISITAYNPSHKLVMKDEKEKQEAVKAEADSSWKKCDEGLLRVLDCQIKQKIVKKNLNGEERLWIDTCVDDFPLTRKDILQYYYQVYYPKRMKKRELLKGDVPGVKYPESDTELSETDDADHTITNNKEVDHNESFNQPKVAPRAKPEYRHKHDQEENKVVLIILAKGIEDKHVVVDFGEQTLSVTIQIPGEDVYQFQPHLFGKVKPEDCSYRVGSNKIEVHLAKADPISWSTLEFTKETLVLPAYSETDEQSVGASSLGDHSDTISDALKTLQLDSTKDKSGTAKAALESGSSLVPGDAVVNCEAKGKGWERKGNNRSGKESQGFGI